MGLFGVFYYVIKLNLVVVIVGKFLINFGIIVNNMKFVCLNDFGMLFDILWLN